MTCTFPKRFDCVLFADTEAGRRASEEYRRKNQCGEPAVIVREVSIAGQKITIAQCSKHRRD